jgi:hypothetical protein
MCVIVGTNSAAANPVKKTSFVLVTTSGPVQITNMGEGKKRKKKSKFWSFSRERNRQKLHADMMSIEQGA